MGAIHPCCEQEQAEVMDRSGMEGVQSQMLGELPAPHGRSSTEDLQEEHQLLREKVQMQQQPQQEEQEQDPEVPNEGPDLGIAGSALGPQEDAVVSLRTGCVRASSYPPGQKPCANGNRFGAPRFRSGVFLASAEAVPAETRPPPVKSCPDVLCPAELGAPRRKPPPLLALVPVPAPQPPPSWREPPTPPSSVDSSSAPSPRQTVAALGLPGLAIPRPPQSPLPSECSTATSPQNSPLPSQRSPVAERQVDELLPAAASSEPVLLSFLLQDLEKAEELAYGSAFVGFGPDADGSVPLDSPALRNFLLAHSNIPAEELDTELCNVTGTEQCLSMSQFLYLLRTYALSETSAMATFKELLTTSETNDGKSLTPQACYDGLHVFATRHLGLLTLSQFNEKQQGCMFRSVMRQEICIAISVHTWKRYCRRLARIINLASFAEH